MNILSNLFGSQNKIKTIKSGDCQVSFSPKRGGIITSLKIRNREILYFDDETFKDKHQSVRGGIPILFPNAGEIPETNKSKIFKNLKRHGFARNSKRWQFKKYDREFEETLTDDSISQDIYPYSFRLTVKGVIEDNNSVTVYQEVENTSSEIMMPIAMGLHPYFRVKDALKKDIIFNFEGGQKISENFAIWSQGGTVYIDNPNCQDKNATLKVFIPGLGNLLLDICAEYKKIWVWSLPGKDFICLEPMQRGQAGIVDDPVIVLPRENISQSMKISLEF